MTLGTLISVSRPRFWLYLVGPYLLGYVAGMREPQSLLSSNFWLYLLYFLGPANFFLYGINDLADQDTDRFNPKKGNQEHHLESRETKTLLVGLVAHVILTLILILTLTEWTTRVWLWLLLGLSFAYSHPPFRWKAQPIIDSASNVLYLIPGLFSYSILTNSLPPWWILVAGAVWTAAMHLFSAIPDIKADSQVELFTTAVTFGQTKSLLFCVILWTIFSGLLTWQMPQLLSIMWWIYPVIPLLVLIRKLDITKSYWSFPVVNGVVGFISFWLLMWQRFGGRL